MANAALARLRTVELAASSASLCPREFPSHPPRAQLYVPWDSQQQSHGQNLSSRPASTACRQSGAPDLLFICNDRLHSGSLQCVSTVANHARYSPSRAARFVPVLSPEGTFLSLSRSSPCGSTNAFADAAGSSGLLRQLPERRHIQRKMSRRAFHESSAAAISSELAEEATEAASHDGSNERSQHADVEDGLAESQADAAQEVEISRAMLIWRAVKLPIYTVALVPLTVGSAAAYLDTGRFYPSRYWSFLLFSILVIAWLNLSNDAFDAETGVDKDKVESVVNMTGSRRGVLAAAFGCLLVGSVGIGQGAMAVGDPRVGVLLAAAIACGYVYQCPPFRLSYKGLGEPLCLLAFGPLATTAFYLVQASAPGSLPAVSATVAAASVLVGTTTTLILFCSHFHQIEGDRAVGKLSPLVRVGTARGAGVVQGAVLGLYALTAAFVAAGLLPLSCAVGALLTVPIGRLVVSFVRSNHEGSEILSEDLWDRNRSQPLTRRPVPGVRTRRQSSWRSTFVCGCIQPLA